MDIVSELKHIGDGGGAVTINGNPSDAADVLVKLNELDAADQGMIEDELLGIINNMKWRMLPGQYIPTGEGPAPTVDFQFPGFQNPGRRKTSWNISVRWDR